MKNLLLIFVLLPLASAGQVAGEQTFSSLWLINNARSAALGGSAVSQTDGDLTQFFNNPATLDSATVSDAAFMVNPYFADATFYSVATIFNVKGQKIAAGINYFNFGDFEGANDIGIDAEDFHANDYHIVLGTAHRLGPISMGVNLKVIGSSIAGYSASAIAADVGGVFAINPQWSVGMVFENMGAVLSHYSPTADMSLPFDVRIGTTFKPTYMPFRFTITTNSLVDPVVTDGEDDNNAALDKALRRLAIGTEIVFSDSFQVLLGYNHNRKQELKLSETSGGAGFSYGFLLRVNRFFFRFSRMTYHAAGGTSLISVQTNFNDFKKIL